MASTTVSRALKPSPARACDNAKTARRSVARLSTRFPADVHASSLVDDPEILRTPRLFCSLAAYADVSASLQRFENASGRAAMIGTLVALGTEVLTDDGIFSGLQYNDVAEYCSLVGMGVLAAAGIAAQARIPIGLDLRGLVTKSLTSFSHGGASDDEPMLFLDAVLDDVVDSRLLKLISGDDEAV